jgi:hypothetical protein
LVNFTLAGYGGAVPHLDRAKAHVATHIQHRELCVSFATGVSPRRCRKCVNNQLLGTFRQSGGLSWAAALAVRLRI